MSEKKNILIIDDDKDYAEALKIVLVNNGYAVDCALNIRDGRKAIEKNIPNLIILDVMMDKHTDGFDLWSMSWEAGFPVSGSRFFMRASYGIARGL